jgi:hypothetical protein
MSTLTRRRNPEAREESWHIYCGDVRVGTIAMKVGASSDVDQWRWVCDPGSHPGEQLAGSAPDFEQARADFEAARRIFSARRTAADYQASRDDRDWTSWKYAMWDVGLKMPTQTPDGAERCFCGAIIDAGGVQDHVRTTHAMRPQ